MISAACPDKLMGIRDRALVLTHFAVAGREHGLASNRVRDYAETLGGIQTDLRVSKVRPVSFRSRSALAPRSALSVPGKCGGSRRPHRPGRIHLRGLHNRWHTVIAGGLEPESIGDVATRAGECAGIGIRFTGHSLAAGSPLRPA
ncbi:hypothetical protein [Streptomyces sp. NPDC087859]|uniref:hypothetical protein n=1 Tax=Streptomyces sp. NPDC087859 TaxID=3365812 RepID=UPI00382EAA38